VGLVGRDSLRPLRATLRVRDSSESETGPEGWAKKRGKIPLSHLEGGRKKILYKGGK